MRIASLRCHGCGWEASVSELDYIEAISGSRRGTVLLVCPRCREPGLDDDRGGEVIEKIVHTVSV